jgi:APA family basic amino acid/polyamine antiporter
MNALPLFRRKPQAAFQPSEAERGPRLKRVLGPLDLTLLGVGAVIGTGIFVLTGTAAAGGAGHVGAGPALTVSMAIAGVACALAALCYAEFASMIPVAGSAYTYAYASFGELFAWIIGWDLVLEYSVSAVAVSIGWGGYFKTLLGMAGLGFPTWLSVDPMSAARALHGADPAAAEQARLAFEQAPRLFDVPLVINLPAVLVIFVVTALLVVGTRESARVNGLMVAIKLTMVTLIVLVGVRHVDLATHWADFAPSGWDGVMTGAALIFFAYIGFDAVSTTAEEARNPQRDLPIGMIVSLAICTVLYIAVAAVLTGMVPLSVLANERPVAAALQAVGEGGVAAVISAGAVFSIPSVLLVMQLGQTRIFYSMSRDGLLPRAFSRVHPRFGTPALTTLVTGGVVALFAGLVDIAVAAELTNIGTLFAFALVAGGVLVLRVQAPERPRAFRVPAVWVVAPTCIAVCLYLMAALTRVTWERFGLWLVVGLAIYFAYGRRKSALAPGEAPLVPAPPEPAGSSS